MVRKDVWYDFNLLNLLKLVLCPNVWSILKNVPCGLENNVYSATLRWNALKISMKSIWSSTSFKAAASLLAFCLEDQSSDVNGIKICYNDCIAIDLFLCIHQDLLYTFRGSCVGCINIYKGYVLLLNCSLYHYVVSFSVSYYSLCLKVYFVRYKYCYPSFLLIAICMKYLFQSLYI